METNELSIIYSTNKSTQQINLMKSSILTIAHSNKRDLAKIKIEILYFSKEFTPFKYEMQDFFKKNNISNFVIHDIYSLDINIKDILVTSPNIIQLISSYVTKSNFTLNLDNDTLVFSRINAIFRQYYKYLNKSPIVCLYWKKDITEYDKYSNFEMHYRNSPEASSNTMRNNYLRRPCLWSYLVNVKLFRKSLSFDELQENLLRFREITFKNYSHQDGFTDKIKRTEFEIKRSSPTINSQKIFDEPFIFWIFNEEIYFLNLVDKKRIFFNYYLSANKLINKIKKNEMILHLLITSHKYEEKNDYTLFLLSDASIQERKKMLKVWVKGFIERRNENWMESNSNFTPNKKNDTYLESRIYKRLKKLIK